MVALGSGLLQAIEVFAWIPKAASEVDGRLDARVISHPPHHAHETRASRLFVPGIRWLRRGCGAPDAATHLRNIFYRMGAPPCAFLRRASQPRHTSAFEVGSVGPGNVTSGAAVGPAT